MFRRFHVSSAGLESPSAIRDRHSHRSDSHATLDSTRSQVHITSSSPTHLNPQKQRKPASDPSERPTSSHLHALDNKSPPSGGYQSFSPAPKGPATVTCYQLVASRMLVKNGRHLRLTHPSVAFMLLGTLFGCTARLPDVNQPPNTLATPGTRQGAERDQAEDS